MSRAERRHPSGGSNWKIWVVVVLLVAALVTGIVYANTRGTGVDYTQYSYGDERYDRPNATVTLEEFSDFQCPACQSAAAGVHAFRDTAPDTVRIVYKHFPLRSIHPLAQGAAEASECAREQGRFWAYHDVLFESGKLEPRALKLHAEGLGLDMARWQSCMDEGRAKTAVQRDYLEGQQRGVRGTPTFYIDGVPYNGERTAAAFTAATAR